MEFLVEKIGMSRTISVPSYAVTLVKVLDAKVCEIDENKKAIVAYSNGKKFNKAIEGQQKKYNLSKEFNRFVTLTVANNEPGDIDTSVLEAGKIVKTTFKTKGRGFTGAVKRWNFAGGRSSHGHRMGRRTGSVGMCEWPGRIQPGQKMPGHYGNTNVTHKNEIVSFDKESSILVLKGSVAGANGTIGKVRIA